MGQMKDSLTLAIVCVSSSQESVSPRRDGWIWLDLVGPGGICCQIEISLWCLGAVQCFAKEF